VRSSLIFLNMGAQNWTVY